MDYKVIWRDDAISDLRKAVEHIARHNPIAAKRTGDTILEKVRPLSRFPRIGKVFAKLDRDDILPVPPYRIVYLIQDSAWIVTIFLDRLARCSTRT
jgi:plasmid stabilization system protein ParE